MVSNAAVLPREYLVERIICKKSTNEGDLFLIKWQGYHQQESTWKPARHIPGDLVTLYLSPTVSPERLHAAAEAFERAVQQRLSTKNSTVTTGFSLDIYRSVFGTDDDVLVTSYQELSKLPLCRNWYYKINKYGRGATLSLPMRLQPRCLMRPVYVRTEDQTFVKMSLPVEEIVLISAIKPFM